MPAKSRKQQKMIFAKRGIFKNKANTPEKWKWIWDAGWEKLEEEISHLDKYLKHIYEDEETMKEQTIEVGPSENEIMNFFAKSKKPMQDKVIHSLADKLGIEHDDFEGEIYRILRSFLGEGKFVKSGKKESDFDPKEIEMGVKVEYEHTNNPKIALRIALDHLSDRPDYYSFGKKCGIFDELK